MSEHEESFQCNGCLSGKFDSDVNYVAFYTVPQKRSADICGNNSIKSALSLWLSTVRRGLGRLLVHGPGFKSQGWPGNLGQDGVCVCFDINFSDRKEGSTVSSIICDRWCILH